MLYGICCHASTVVLGSLSQSLPSPPVLLAKTLPPSVQLRKAELAPSGSKYPESYVSRYMSDRALTLVASRVQQDANEHCHSTNLQQEIADILEDATN